MFLRVLEESLRAKVGDLFSVGECSSCICLHISWVLVVVVFVVVAYSCSLFLPSFSIARILRPSSKVGVFTTISKVDRYFIVNLHLQVIMDTVLIESDTVANAIIELIPVLHIRRLVMGVSKSNAR